MNGLALCAGYGGLELGIERVFPEARTVCYVEGEAFAVQHIIKKMEEGSLDAAPIWSNVKTFDGKPWRGKVDWLSGGFPCQPYSTAGKQMGEADARDLWPDFVRIIGEVRPGFLFLENVPNVVKLRLNQIILDLDKLGYHVAWGNLSAAEVGAAHKRNRWFCFAVICDSNGDRFSQYSRNEKDHERIIEKRKLEGSIIERISNIDPSSMADSNLHDGRPGNSTKPHNRKTRLESGRCSKGQSFTKSNKKIDLYTDNSIECISDTSCERIKRIGRINGETQAFEQGKGHFNQGDKWAGGFDSWWEVEPSMGRLVDGASDWVDKLRLLGNGVVPQQAAQAFQILGDRLAMAITEKK